MTTYDTFTAQEILDNHAATNTVYGRGDVVQILKWNWLFGFQGYHTMYVTDVDDHSNKGTLKLTYHSSNTKDKTLSSICESYNSSDYRIRLYKIT